MRTSIEDRSDVLKPINIHDIITITDITMTSKFAIGTKHTVRDGEIIITGYIDYDRREVQFTSTGYTTITGVRDIRAGQVKDRLKPSFCGVGYIGDESILTHPPLERENNLWRARITLCYHPSGKYYGKVTVDPQWHSRANFIAWLRSQPNYDEWLSGRLDLDRNIKASTPNPPYSPENCCLLDRTHNRHLGGIESAKKLNALRAKRKVNYTGMVLA